MLELKVYNPEDSFLKRIEWNYEELKSYIEPISAEYAASVYTDDMIKKAKEDRIKLNKFKDALEAEKSRVRKKVMEPYETFRLEVDDLTAIIKKAIDNIDGQVKGYEERLREEKTTKVREFYEDNIHDIGKYLPFERVMQPRYALASTTMKSIKEEILALIQKVDEGLAVLNEVDSPYAGDMKKVFLETYDIGAAMAKRNQLEAEEQNRRIYQEELARRKAEQEAQRKAAAESVMAAGRQENVQAAPAGPVKAEEPKMETVEEPVNVIDFRVYATREQLMKLKGFLKENGIRFEPVPKQ